MGQWHRRTGIQGHDWKFCSSRSNCGNRDDCCELQRRTAEESTPTSGFPGRGTGAERPQMLRMRVRAPLLSGVAVFRGWPRGRPCFGNALLYRQSRRGRTSAAGRRFGAGPVLRRHGFCWHFRGRRFRLGTAVLVATSPTDSCGCVGDVVCASAAIWSAGVSLPCGHAVDRVLLCSNVGSEDRFVLTGMGGVKGCAVVVEMRAE